VREIEGGIRIISTSAAIDAKEIAGAAEISTTYAGVTLAEWSEREVPLAQHTSPRGAAPSV